MMPQTQKFTSAADTLGVIGLPAPVKELAARSWDAIVVGAGHNGLACAAYLARAGQRVLVLEARERIGGACTLEEPFPGYIVSPCAYVAGIMHPLVIDELKMRQRGFEWSAANGMFVPFDDGSSIHLWDDEERCEAEINKLAPGDLAGWRAMHDVLTRASDALRPLDERDMWIGRAPTREQVEDRLKGDQEAINFIFEWSMMEYLERYLQDERLQIAYAGQGIIGANASPYDPGTASIYFYHFCGRMGKYLGQWGFVKGGMGMVSFILCDAARELGATVAAGVPVARIIPGEGVELAGGERIHAPVVVSNADPRVTLRLLGEAADSGWQAQVETMPITGCTVKVNVALSELPNFTARPGTMEPHHYAVVDTPLSKAEWQSCFDTARAGHLPERVWTEIYFQTVHDQSVVPPGKHTMSVFAQYVPHTFAEGDWDSQREKAGQMVLNSIGRYCSNIPQAVIDYEVLGPPDIERKVGLTGGHIFQGEITPDFMWDKRLAHRTPMPGVFLCGACTHPGGGVVGLNGRNAAMEILQG
ncbi:MAG: NAD(P)/FAD-dependent oxidoreductase [Anaerolineae bacterium]